jgi:hypothetical protein
MRHAAEERLGDPRVALHGVIAAADPRLEPLVRAAVLGRHADEEIGAGPDAAVGDVVVGEDDEHVGPRCRELAREPGEALPHDLLRARRCLLDQADDGRRVGDAGGVDDLSHAGNLAKTVDPVDFTAVVRALALTSAARSGSVPREVGHECL